jgi:hypothetical protein
VQPAFGMAVSFALVGGSLPAVVAPGASVTVAVRATAGSTAGSGSAWIAASTLEEIAVLSPASPPGPKAAASIKATVVGTQQQDETPISIAAPAATY